MWIACINKLYQILDGKWVPGSIFQNSTRRKLRHLKRCKIKLQSNCTTLKSLTLIIQLKITLILTQGRQNFLAHFRYVPPGSGCWEGGAAEKSEIIINNIVYLNLLCPVSPNFDRRVNSDRPVKSSKTHFTKPWTPVNWPPVKSKFGETGP